MSTQLSMEILGPIRATPEANGARAYRLNECAILRRAALDNSCPGIEVGIGFFALDDELAGRAKSFGHRALLSGHDG